MIKPPGGYSRQPLELIRPAVAKSTKPPFCVPLAPADRHPDYYFIVWIGLARSGFGGFLSSEGRDWETSPSTADALPYWTIRSASNATCSALGLALDHYHVIFCKIAGIPHDAQPVFLAMYPLRSPHGISQAGYADRRHVSF